MALAPPLGPEVAPVGVPAPGAGEPPGGGHASPAAKLRGLLRDVRVEAQDLQRSVRRLREAMSLKDPESRAAEVRRAGMDVQATVLANAQVGTQRLDAIRDLLDTSDELYDRTGDEIARIEKHWQRVLGTLQRGAQDQAGEAYLDELDASLNELIWHVGVLTIPVRLNQHLADVNVGGRLQFAAAVSDELERPEDQARLLQYLSDHPRFVHGVIDGERIYKADQRAWRRWAGYLGLAALASLGGVGFVWLITEGIPLIGLQRGWLFPPQRFSELMAAYVFLLAGAGAHILVGAIKQERRAGPEAFRAIGDWAMWIHVREISIAVGIISLWIALAGLALTLGDEPIAWQTAFFAGYGIDSILDLVIGKFETKSTAGVASLLARLRR